MPEENQKNAKFCKKVPQKPPIEKPVLVSEREARSCVRHFCTCNTNEQNAYKFWHRILTPNVFSALVQAPTPEQRPSTQETKKPTDQ